MVLQMEAYLQAHCNNQQLFHRKAPAQAIAPSRDSCVWAVRPVRESMALIATRPQPNVANP